MINLIDIRNYYVKQKLVEKKSNGINNTRIGVQIKKLSATKVN